MRIYPSSPPLMEAMLPAVPMDGESKPSRPASVSLDGVLVNSILPDNRPSTPPNQSATHSTNLDPNPQSRRSESGPDASPSRTLAERKNSSQSITHPLPTRTPVRTKRRSVSSMVSPPATPKVRPLSTALTGTETVDFFGTAKKQPVVVFSTPQERLMLSSLAALGFDTGQIVHSVLSNACDSAGALWWIMRKKLGDNYMLPEEQTGQIAPDPSSDTGLQIIPEASGRGLELDETGQGVAVNGIQPMVLLEEVDASKKKRRPRADSIQDKSDTLASTNEKDKPQSQPAPPDFAIVPATPITAEELSKVTPLPTSPSALSPVRLSPSQASGFDSHNSSPSSSKINQKGGRTSGSISMLQRATTVLGGAAGLVRKKSEEGALKDSMSSREKEKSSEEPRSSNGSGRLTKSPPPGKISKEAKDRERENSGEMPGSQSQKTTATPLTPATFPGHMKSSSTAVKSNIPQPSMRRSATEGSSLTNPSLSRDLAKPRNRSSLLNTFRTWLGNDSKRKGGFSFGTPSNSHAGGLHSSPPSAYPKGYFNRDFYVPSGYPERAQTPRKRASNGKGTASRRGGRGHKDKRPSVSSRRSSSVNSRRSSVGSMASLAKQKGVLGSVDEYTVYNGEPLSRRMSSNSRRSVGAKTPIDEDPFGHSRPNSARSNSMNTSLAKRGKRHSKSSSTSSGGSLGRHGGSNRPPSRSGTTSPTGNRAHRRVGSGGSQTRVVKQHVKASSSIAKSLAAGATEHATISTGTRRARSGSQSSARSEEMSAVEDDAEFGGRRTTSPLGKPMRTVMVAQKKSAFGTPSGSLGLSASRSSWKRSWGPEPPGWAHRAAHPGVVIEILDSRNTKAGVRDVFAGGGKSGVAPGTTPPADDDDDWSDIDDDFLYAGGLGQLGSSHNSPPNVNDSIMSPDSPMMVFTHSRAGRRTKRTPGNTSTTPGQYIKPGGSPSPSAAAPASPPNQTATTSMNESINLDRSTSRRQLPGNRTFRGPAIVEEEEEEEE